LFIHEDLYQTLQFHLEQNLQQFSRKINAKIKCFINQNGIKRQIFAATGILLFDFEFFIGDRYDLLDNNH